MKNARESRAGVRERGGNVVSAARLAATTRRISPVNRADAFSDNMITTSSRHTITLGFFVVLRLVSCVALVPSDDKYYVLLRRVRRTLTRRR